MSQSFNDLLSVTGLLEIPRAYLLVTLFTFSAISLRILTVSKQRSRLRLPPGPSGRFIVGNALQIPRSEPWIWCGLPFKETYGASVLSMSNQ